MVVMGVDPGLRGAWAVLDYGVTPLGCETGLLRWSEKYGVPWLDICSMMPVARVDMVCVEAQRVRMTGRKASFTLGSGYGLLLKAVETFGCPVRVVKVEEWQKSIRFRPGRSKEASCARAAKLVGRKAVLGANGRAHDGICDAINIAEWCYREQERGASCL